MAGYRSSPIKIVSLVHLGYPIDTFALFGSHPFVDQFYGAFCFYPLGELEVVVIDGPWGLLFRTGALNLLCRVLRCGSLNVF
ncbi:hypothetical protein CEXT_32731 [Caerostris extrusa]|uniref:Uncharacterized protein n=1 Tax=Caerostris extrusa TaxID=172846 RepID=A0AAV4SK84_CAEEX|nr:hypothetical protein CEXT_32731 [Caerostris extrusa]